MTELQTYQRDKNEVLYDLGPTDDDVMQWRAVMKGVPGTAYEGMYTSPKQPNAYTPTNPPPRRLLAPLHLHPIYVPPRAPDYPLHNAHLPPEC